jgi:hypothetical protein
VATGIGLGISSTVYFLALLFFDGAPSSVVVLDVIALAAGGAAWRWRRGATSSAVAAPARPDARGERFPLYLSSLFGLVLLASLAGFILSAIRQPHGQWDAWAIWNAKARFLAGAGAGWRVVLTEEAVTPDYPLLLPGAIARAWTYAGTEPPLVSIAVAALFAVATIALATSALSILRGRAQGMIGGLLVAPVLLAEAANQYADVPLSFYILATLVLLAFHDRFDRAGKGLPVLGGLMAGMAAWTKNEGVVFLLLVVGARAAWTLLDGARARWASLLWFSLASLPFLVLNAILRFWLLESAAPVTFLRWDALRTQIFAPARYAQVALAVAGQADGTMLALPAVVVAGILLGAGTDREVRKLARTGLSVLSLMLAAYFAVYVVTPHDLTWHVSTTLSRLLVQVVPLAVFAVLVAAASSPGVEKPPALPAK